MNGNWILDANTRKKLRKSKESLFPQVLDSICCCREDTVIQEIDVESS